MISVMVTYKVKADRVDENEGLVRAVYAELADIDDPDVHYATFRKDDGQTFVHIAFFPSQEKQAVLSNTAAFKAFQENLPDRCDVPPKPEPITHIGAHRFQFPI